MFQTIPFPISPCVTQESAQRHTHYLNEGILKEMFIYLYQGNPEKIGLKVSCGKTLLYQSSLEEPLSLTHKYISEELCQPIRGKEDCIKIEGYNEDETQTAIIMLDFTLIGNDNHVSYRNTKRRGIYNG